MLASIHPDQRPDLSTTTYSHVRDPETNEVASWRPQLPLRRSDRAQEGQLKADQPATDIAAYQLARVLRQTRRATRGTNRDREYRKPGGDCSRALRPATRRGHALPVRLLLGGPADEPAAPSQGRPAVEPLAPPCGRASSGEPARRGRIPGAQGCYDATAGRVRRGSGRPV